jgi:hypothetical protein
MKAFIKVLRNDDGVPEEELKKFVDPTLHGSVLYK